jgi:hypothetical protein
MSVQDGQNNLRRIANYLDWQANFLRQIADNFDRRVVLTNENYEFLSHALRKIADGEDAKKALGVNAKRGERTSKNEQNRICESEIKKLSALAWIAAAKASEEESGLELTLEAAISMIGEHDLNAFGLTEETLKTYWNSNPEKRGLEFKLPD